MNNYGNKQESDTDNDNTISPYNMISSSNMNSNDLVEQASGGGIGDIEKGTNTSDSLPDDGDIQRQEYTDRNGQHHPIAEFLYQLTKMLTDDNVEIIEWVDGRIKVHYPERLEGEVLHKYFRHSKFASFQRQLNYFGFRKIAGKGKMSPCSYVNEGATSDIRSLLLIKRKTNGSAARKAALHQRAPSGAGNSAGAGAGPGIASGPLPNQGINPSLAGMNFSSLAAASGQPMNVNSQAFTNAMALLSENALRASLGRMQQQHQQQNQGQNQGQGHGGNNMSAQQTMNILALQQQQFNQQHQNEQLQQLHQQHQQQQQQQDHSFQQNHNQNHQHHHQQLDGMHSSNHGHGHGHGHNNTNHSNTPTLEQLHAQLAASLAAKQQKPINATSLSASALNLATSMSTNSALRSGGGQSSSADNPATAALKAQLSSTPATAAMDAASATTNANGFESSANLQSLLSQNGGMHPPSFAAPGQRQGSLLNRLPSANTIFPENMSTASFGNLLGSSNRLSSLLSLNSFLGSREPSMADFAAATGMPPNMSAQQFAAEFAASGANGVSQSYADANKYRSN
jgi:hypothetical protein